MKYKKFNKMKMLKQKITKPFPPICQLDFLILPGGARCKDDQPVSEERRKILMDLWSFSGQIVGVAFEECSD